VLSRLVSARGAPRFLRSDNGPEFVSKALLSWIVMSKRPVNPPHLWASNFPQF